MKQGDTAWIIENNRTVRECKIVRINGNLVIIRFTDGCGTQLPLKRLYETQEDAYEELSYNDTLSRIQVEYDTENRRKWNGQML
ncbi:hypothetical protein [Roseburia faecis]|jgi:hypothetical protein|uniref:hypothetical protein n=1 Tax=Roseburia faecis TaxID=301302 RepID=UPI0031B56A73